MGDSMAWNGREQALKVLNRRDAVDYWVDCRRVCNIYRCRIVHCAEHLTPVLNGE